LLLVDRQFGTDTERGLKILEIIKLARPSQEVILLTNFLDQHATKSALRDDAYTVLEKKAGPEALLREVRSGMLKKVLRLGHLPKVSMNRFFAEAALAPLREQILDASEPYACFLELAALAHLLAAAGWADSATLRRVTERSGLVQQ